MAKKCGEVIVVVGLPGSGKSTLMRSLRKQATGMVSDDFMRLIPPSPTRREPTMTDSLDYPRLVRDLRRGKRCVVSDVIFCDALMRAQLESALRHDVENFEIVWEYFEKNLKACERNARRRARKDSLKLEIALIRHLGRKYFVPQGVRPHRVWKGKTN